MDENDQNKGNAEQPTQDDQEWSRAFDEFSANKGISTVDSDEEVKKSQTPEEKQAAEAQAEADKKTAAEAEEKKKADEAEAEKAKDETPEQTEARHKKEADDKKAAEVAEAAAKDDPDFRQARVTARELEEDRKQTITDVREKMFPDFTTEITDADGDPIRTPEDVMKLLNPNTNKAFTYEEASLYLLQKQQYLNRENEKIETQVRDIAEVNITIKDEIAAVKSRWGKILSEKPELAKETWADYKATLVVDPKTKIIIKAPVPMERFYNRALAGYETSTNEVEAATAQATAAEAAKKTAEAKAERIQNRGDRGDITSNGKSDTTDPEDKEWREAFKNHYEGK